MTDPIQDDLSTAIANAITGNSGDPAPLVSSYVVIASFLGSDGERALYTDTPDGQRCHETLGLLTFGTAVETHRASHPDS